MLLSIIVPVYNVAPYLRECLDSVIGQSERDIEVICVDDGSTDGSAEILDEYARRDGRIHVLHQENRGVAAARNLGIEMARGEFVAFVDPDDKYPDEQVLSDLVKAAQSNGADVCGGCLVEMSGISQEPGMTFVRDGLMDYADYQYEYGFYRYIFRRTLLVDGGVRFPSLKRFQDVPFLVEAMHRAGRFYALARPTYCYRTGHKRVDWAKDDSARAVDNMIGMVRTYDLAREYGYDRMADRMKLRICDFQKLLGSEIRMLREAAGEERFGGWMMKDMRRLDDCKVIFPLLFPREGIYQPLEVYYHTDGFFLEELGAICLNEGRVCVSDSYFNSFDADFWRVNTGVKRVSLRLRIKGAFILRIYSSRDPGNARERMLYEGSIDGSGESQLLPYAFSLGSVRGMLVVELVSQADGGIYFGGEFVTVEEPVVDSPRIAMVVCTCRREHYVLANLEQWKRDLFEKEEWKSRFELHLVDNGNTLKDLSAAGVRLYANPNSGGSGGFSRGMIEAVKGDATHVLLMDDDLVLHSGVMYRGWYLTRYLKPRKCISAAMINLAGDMCIQHERGGAVVHNGDNAVAFNMPIGFGEDIRRFSSVFNCRHEGFVYGAWWWFLCPITAWREDDIGFSFPFFVKGDDIDFNLRLNKKGYECQCPGGMAVWHEPFDKKESAKIFYLILRNNLIVAALHDIGYAWPALLFKEIFTDIMTFHYGTAKMKMAGVREFLDGPSSILSHDPVWPLRFNGEKFEEDVRSQNLLPNIWPNPIESGFVKLLSYVTLGGMLLPSKRAVPTYDITNRIRTKFDTFRRSRVTYFQGRTGMAYTVTRNRCTALVQTVSLIALVLRMRFRRNAVTIKWRAAYQELTSEAFWRKYLGL